jgi:subtilisin family serine protease
MRSKTRFRGRINPAGAVSALRFAFAAVAAATLGMPSSAQLLDSTLDAILDDVVDQQVEEQLEEVIEDTVEQLIESDVVDAVEQRVESDVVDAVEQQIEADVADTVDQLVESGVTETIEQQIESGVTKTLEQVIEADVTETIEQVIESGVTGTLEQVIESSVTEALTQQLEATVENTLDGDGAGQIVERAGQARGEETAPGEEGAGQEATSTAAERFAAGLDDVGRAIEREVWVVLVPAEHVARIQGWGFTIREQHNLEALDRVLLRVDAPEDRDIAQAALDLALDAPGTLVDFNHVYRAGQEGSGIAADAATHAGMPRSRPEAAPRGLVPEAAPTMPRGPVAITVGVVDSAVAIEHAAFLGADIVQQDFVPFGDPRLLRHGTAVASILVGDTGVLRGRPGGARLYAASVFFEDDAGNPAATTASLVEGLAWLAAEDVRVVNMSLAGPPNRVLEAAIAQTAARGTIVVAAVGNNGPVGEPLYPAAYEQVVGVTAVDSAHRIYRYANRGQHVTFAAPGVRIKVARSDGGYATESGTSMAAPFAAAIIARSIAAGAADSTEDVLETLKAAAIDLGKKDFDDVFGYGLIAALE